MRDPRTGGLVAVRNRCPHSGAQLCLGTVEQRIEGEPGGRYELVDRTVVVCPWHGWEFDLASGRSVGEPVRSIKTFPVSVAEGWILVED